MACSAGRRPDLLQMQQVQVLELPLLLQMQQV